MIAVRHPVLSCAALLACGLASAAAAPGQAPDIFALMRRQPMIFFVAKGEPNACGAGCSEWIAAEGLVDPEVAQRFRDFLGALPRRDLPIFFHSNGGDAVAAVLLGVILREHRMTAGVGRTLPKGCRHAVAIDDACRRLMQSKREHSARLVTGGARCLSACVYALIGGSVRQVARDAQLGIHSLRMPQRTEAPPQGAPRNIDEANRRLKRYLIEMGIDPGLIDAAAKVSPDRIRYLSRDEIARFGIEVREFYETPWMPYEDVSQRVHLLKSVTQAEGADGTDYRSSLVLIGCETASWTPFLLRRELRPNEIGVASVISVAVGDSVFVLEKEKRVTKGAIEVRYGLAGLQFVRNAMAAPHIVIAEAFTPAGNAPGWSRLVKFSTKGLSKALEQLQKDCGGTKLLDAPGVGGGR